MILFCLERDFLGARVALDRGAGRGRSSPAPTSPLEEHLAASRDLRRRGRRGPIGALTQRERFHWLVAPRSTIVQVSPVHTGLCDDPERALAELMDRMVRVRGGPMEPWEIVDAPRRRRRARARPARRRVGRAGRGRMLMSSRVHGSEEALAEIALRRPRRRARCWSAGWAWVHAPRRARSAPARARVIVVELVPASWTGIAARSRTSPGGRSTTRASGSSKETLATGSRAEGAFDAILLDVDNGPNALTHGQRRALRRPGIRAARRTAGRRRARGLVGRAGRAVPRAPRAGGARARRGDRHGARRSGRRPARRDPRGRSPTRGRGASLLRGPELPGRPPAAESGD